MRVFEYTTLLSLFLCLVALTGGKIYDLSHVHLPSTFVFDDNFRVPHYKQTRIFGGTYGKANVYVDLGSIEASEHSGTHIDAPNHFVEGGKSLAEVTVDMAMGSGVMVDCKEEAANDQNYVMPVQKLLDWEKKYGRIPDQACIIINFGWSKYFTNHTAFKGSKDEFLYPYISDEAGLWMFNERNIKLLAVDTLSPDSMNPKNGEHYRIHIALLGNDRLIVENLKIPDDLPARYFRFYAVPAKYSKSTGIQVRAFAVDESACGNGVGTIGPMIALLLVFSLLFIDAFL